MQHTARSLGDVSLCKRHECRGCEPLPQPTDRTSAEIWLRSHARDLSFMSRLRRIVAGEGFGAGLSRLSDDRVRAHVAQMLADGTLLVCGRRHGDGAARADAGPERVAIERLLRHLPNAGREFTFEGKRFRLIRADEWRDLSAQEQYRVVATDAARSLIERIAAATTSAPAKRAFEEAASMLARTEGGRFGPGLLLLSITPEPFGSSSSPSKPAVTPSQLAGAVAPELTWVELELLDDTGVAIADAKYLIVGPDGQEHSGVTDAKGRGRLDGIPPGQCRISFPGMDKDAWAAA